MYKLHSPSAFTRSNERIIGRVLIAKAYAAYIHRLGIFSLNRHLDRSNRRSLGSRPRQHLWHIGRDVLRRRDAVQPQLVVDVLVALRVVLARLVFANYLAWALEALLAVVCTIFSLLFAFHHDALEPHPSELKRVPDANPVASDTLLIRHVIHILDYHPQFLRWIDLFLLLLLYSPLMIDPIEVVFEQDFGSSGRRFDTRLFLKIFEDHLVVDSVE